MPHTHTHVLMHSARNRTKIKKRKEFFFQTLSTISNFSTNHFCFFILFLLKPRSRSVKYCLCSSLPNLNKVWVFNVVADRLGWPNSASCPAKDSLAKASTGSWFLLCSSHDLPFPGATMASVKCGLNGENFGAMFNLLVTRFWNEKIEFFFFYLYKTFHKIKMVYTQQLHNQAF